MWTTILSLFSKSPDVGAGTFETSLLRIQQADLADEKRRRNASILMLGLGVVGFAGIIYLVGRK